MLEVEIAENGIEVAFGDEVQIAAGGIQRGSASSLRPSLTGNDRLVLREWMNTLPIPLGMGLV